MLNSCRVVNLCSSSGVCPASSVHRTSSRHHCHLHVPGAGWADSSAHVAKERSDPGTRWSRQAQEQQQVRKKNSSRMLSSPVLLQCFIFWDRILSVIFAWAWELNLFPQTSFFFLLRCCIKFLLLLRLCLRLRVDLFHSTHQR